MSTPRRAGSGGVCALCGKRPSFGNKVSRLGRHAVTRHVKSRTRRQWRPNIQRVRAVIDGRVRRIYVCTSCIKAGKVQKPPRGGGG
jgi:large subunit ribosomal protein L28